VAILSLSPDRERGRGQTLRPGDRLGLLQGARGNLSGGLVARHAPDLRRAGLQGVTVHSRPTPRCVSVWQPSAGPRRRSIWAFGAHRLGQPLARWPQDTAAGSRATVAQRPHKHGEEGAFWHPVAWRAERLRDSGTYVARGLAADGRPIVHAAKAVPCPPARRLNGTEVGGSRAIPSCSCPETASADDVGHALVRGMWERFRQRHYANRHYTGSDAHGRVHGDDNADRPVPPACRQLFDADRV
jgi:hypothetical protein